jgi:hypothetical protein
MGALRGPPNPPVEALRGSQANPACLAANQFFGARGGALFTYLSNHASVS